MQKVTVIMVPVVILTALEASRKYVKGGATIKELLARHYGVDAKTKVQWYLVR